MATQASRTAPSSPNSSALNSPRQRDWGILKTGEPGSAFRGIGRGRGVTRGKSARGGRGGPSSPGRRNGRPRAERLESRPDIPASKTDTSLNHKESVSVLTPSAEQSNGVSEKPINALAERGGRPKSSSRRTSRAAAAAVVAPPSPRSKTTQSAPSTPSRTNRRRHSHQQGKSSSTTHPKPPLPSTIHGLQKTENGLEPAPPRRDIPPHLAAAHGAEIRHDVDALVERVRAVAMAENRPTTPGSHIDWAGDEDDSLPDLDDWGVTTTRRSNNGEQSSGISPILADALKPLPEPQSEVEHGDGQEMESYDAHHPDDEGSEEVPAFSSLHSSPGQEDAFATPVIEKSPDGNATEPFPESVSTTSNGLLHPSLPSKPLAAIESLCTRALSDQPVLAPKPSPRSAPEELPSAKIVGLPESIHAPIPGERPLLERISSSSSSEQGLSASIHAPKSSLPESCSAPSLLSSHSTSTVSRPLSPHAGGRLGFQQAHTTHANKASHRFSRSSGSSPLGKHVYSHSRNRSTPPVGGSGGQRVSQASRPVISGEAISRLARTIGGLGPNPRAQKDSTITS